MSTSPRPRRRRVARSLRLTRITHGDLRGFWMLYRPGMRYPDVQYGGRPLLAFKVWGRGQ